MFMYPDPPTVIKPAIRDAKAELTDNNVSEIKNKENDAIFAFQVQPAGP